MNRSIRTSILFTLLLSARLASADPSAQTKLAPAQQARLDEAEKLNERVVALYHQDKFREAIPLAEKVLAIRKDVVGPSHSLYASGLNNLAMLYESTGDYARAEPLLQQTLAIEKEVLGEEHPSYVRSLQNLALLYESMGAYARAEPLLKQALAIRKKTRGEQDPLYADSLHELVRLYIAMGDNAGAEPLCRQALAIRKMALGAEHPDYAISLNDLALLYKWKGDYAQAEPLYKQALAITKKNLGEENPSYASNLHNLAALYEAMGDYKRAGDLYQQALAIRKKVLGEEHPDYATNLNNFAVLLTTLREYEWAESLHQQALAIRKKALGEAHPDYAASLNNLAQLYVATKDYARAEPLFQQAVAINAKTLGKQHREYASSLNNLAGVYYEMGDYARAKPLYESALEICRQILGENHPDTAGRLHNLSCTLAELGQWESAAINENESRRVIRRHAARVLPGLTEKEQLLFLERNDVQQLHVGLTIGYLRAQDSQIKQLSAGWLANGKAIAQEALAARALLTRESRDPNLAPTVDKLLQTRRQLAALAMAAPRPGQEQAHRAELAAFEENEEILSRRLGRAGGQSAAADPWIELAAIREKLPPAAVLIDIARFEMANFQATDKQDESRSIRYVAWIIPPAGDREIEIVDFGPADKIDQAVAAARKVLRNPGIAVASRGLEVEEPATQTGQAASAAPRQLAELVLDPILAQVGDAKRLIISPDAALWLVPWGALPLADGSFAIEKYSIRYVISARDLVAQPSKEKTSKPIVMADPAYDLSPTAAAAATVAVLRARPPASDLAQRSASAAGSTIGRAERLPGTAAEAKAISPALARFANAEPIVYLDQYALEGVFKALVRPRALVLGTHGFFLADQDVEPDERAGLLAAGAKRGDALAVDGKPLENPLLRCGLLLAGCNERGQESGKLSHGDDGILTGMEVVGTDLRGTELVVLSACETGLGEVHNGEGVAGLRQAFQLAGAEAVVASLWSVPDRHTADLMTSFFANLAKGQSKADALRGAQLAMIKSLRAKSGAAHPYFWAAFTLTGG